MAHKISYQISCVDDQAPLQNCKIVLNSKKGKESPSVEVGRELSNFGSRYYAPGMELNLYENVGGWLNVQELRRIAAAGAVPRPSSTDNVSKFYEDFTLAIHQKTGVEGVRVFFDSYPMTSCAEMSPLKGLAIYISTSGLSNLASGLEGKGPLANYGRAFRTTVIHETVHLRQFFSFDPNIQSVLTLDWIEGFDSSIKKLESDSELNKLLRFEYRRSTPKEIQEAFDQFKETAKGRGVELDLNLTEIDIRKYSRRSYSKNDGVVLKYMLQDLAMRKIVDQLAKSVNLKTEGFYSSAEFVYRHWQHELNDDLNLKIEDEAHIAEVMLDDYLTKSSPSRTYTNDGSRKTIPFPFHKNYTNLDSAKDEQLVESLTLLLNRRSFVYGMHVLDLGGNLLFVVDVAIAVDDLQNFDEAPARAIYSGGRALVSSTAGVFGTVAILSNNPLTRQLFRKITGPLGGALAFTHSVDVMESNLSRPEEVSNLEKGFIVANTLANTTLLAGLIYGLYLSALSIPSGGILTPAALASGGMVVGAITELGYEKSKEERVAVRLADSLKMLSSSNDKSQQRKVLEKIAEILADNHHELDDNALREFFQIVENDSYLQENIVKILQYPVLDQLRERIIAEFISPSIRFPQSFSDAFTQLSKSLAYQDDLEGAYGMLIALLHKKENPETTKTFVQEVASRLDPSDWQTFDHLLVQYRIRLSEIDPNEWLNNYRPKSFLDYSLMPSQKFMKTGAIL